MSFVHCTHSRKKNPCYFWNHYFFPSVPILQILILNSAIPLALMANKEKKQCAFWVNKKMSRALLLSNSCWITCFLMWKKIAIDFGTNQKEKESRDRATHDRAGPDRLRTFLKMIITAVCTCETVFFCVDSVHSFWQKPKVDGRRKWRRGGFGIISNQNKLCKQIM